MRYEFLNESYDAPIRAANRLADNYFPEMSGAQYEDDRWYAFKRMEQMQAGEEVWINGFLVCAESAEAM